VLAWKRAARIGERRRGSVNFRSWWPSRRKAMTEQPPPIVEADKPTIALIGGTGALGSALARRWASAGYRVVIGSREADKARALAATFGVPPGASAPSGTGNFEAAGMAEIVVLTVPFEGQQAILESIRPNLRGKLVLNSSVPLSPDATDRVPSQGGLCAAMELQRGLGTDARIVSAFHNVPARRLGGDGRVDCDVLVFGDDPDDRETVIGLVEATGMRGIHGGPLVNSAAAEALTSVLIGIGRHYKVDGPSIRITGLD
jgi:8-hydroxy-5-deazaflavin:NADPH oxidoreductase